jgi:hypothetical protein
MPSWRPTSMDGHKNLRKVDLEVRVGEHELSAGECAADKLGGIIGHLLGRAGPFEHEFDVVVSCTR